MIENLKRQCEKFIRILLNLMPLPISFVLTRIFWFDAPLGVQLFKSRRKALSTAPCRKLESKDRACKVLVAPIFGFSQATLAAESIFARALTALGADVEFLSCGQSLKHCMWDSVEYLSTSDASRAERIKRQIRCLECSASINAVSKGAIGKPATTLNKNVLDVERQRTSVIAASSDEHAISSTLRKLLIGEVSDDSQGELVLEHFHNAHSEYRKMLEQIFDRQLPDRVVMTHGIYLEHGPLLDLCNELSIPVYVYAFMYRKNTVSIVKGDTYHRALLSMPRSSWDFSLSENQKSELKRYVGSKISGGRDMVNYHPNPQTDIATIVEDLKLDSAKPVISFFTNVTWDANIFYSSNIYDGMLEAIFHTIDYFLTDYTRQLVIRIHPAEAKGGFDTKQKLQDIIAEKYPCLPSNITVVGSDSDISSYSLADLSDLNIVYASNIGTELCALGHKVMVLGEAYCRNRGFTIDPKSQEETWVALSNVAKGDKATANDKELAEKFAYFWFFKAMIDFDFFEYSIEKNSLAKFNSELLELIDDSGELKNENLAELIGAIIEGRDFDYQKFNADLI